MYITEQLKTHIKTKAGIPDCVDISVLKVSLDFINGTVFFILVDGESKIKQVRLANVK